MSRIHITASVIVLLLLQSHCTTLDGRRYTPSNFNAGASLDGRYQNSGRDSTGASGGELWQQMYYRGFKKTVHDASGQVIIKEESKTRLQVQWVQNDSVMQSATVKGRYKGGWFYAKRYYRIVPIPVLYFFTENHRIRIGKLEDGRLVVDGYDSRFGWILLTAGTQSYFTYIFNPTR
jgi:hypothetical protein